MKETTLRDYVLSVYDTLNTLIKGNILTGATVNDAYTDKEGNSNIDITVKPVIPLETIKIDFSLKVQ